jgi:hypothetical protein
LCTRYNRLRHHFGGSTSRRCLLLTCDGTGGFGRCVAVVVHCREMPASHSEIEPDYPNGLQFNSDVRQADPHRCSNAQRAFDGYATAVPLHDFI